MKKSLLLILATMLVSFASAQPQSREELKLLTTLYYELNEVFAPKAELDKLDEVIELLRQDPTLKVKIEGYGDPVGGEDVNERMSLVRAQSTAEYMVRHKVAESQIIFEGKGIDTSAQSDAEARRVDVSKIITVVIEPAPKPEPKREKPQPKPADQPKTTEELSEERPVAVIPEEPKAEPAPTPAVEKTADGFSLRTNLLYWLTGNINLGAEYKKNSFGYLINGGYSPFENTNWNKQLGSWFIAPEVRYYLGEREAWFVGAQFLAGGYNYKLSDTGYKGSMIGGGVTGGYKLTLSDNFDMDFSLGLGYGTLNYDSYYKHDNGTNVYIDKDVTKNTFMPVQLGVSLIFKL